MSYVSFNISEEDIKNLENKLKMMKIHPTPDPDKCVLKKWLETPEGEFIDAGVYGQPYKKMSIDIKNDQPLKGMSNSYHATWCDPDEDFYEIRLGNTHVRFGKSVYEKLLVHPVLTELHGETYDYIIIDEFTKLSESQIAYLIQEDNFKITCNYEKPKKQYKPKHKIPYWANDWKSRGSRR